MQEVRPLRRRPRLRFPARRAVSAAASAALLAVPARWAVSAVALEPVRRPVPERWAALAAALVLVRRPVPVRWAAARLRRAVLPDREPLPRKVSLAPDAKAVV